MLSPRGYCVRKVSLTKHQLDDLKKDLTMTPVNAMLTTDSNVSFPIFQETQDTLIVPKYFGVQRFGVPLRDTIPVGDDVRLEFTGSLRQEQQSPSDTFLLAARDDKKMGGIISLSCGQGKTVIALYIISVLQKKTMIVVHKDFLLTQWRERIKEFLPGARVGLIKGKVCDVQDKDIVIASVQSLSMKEFAQSVFNGIGLVVVDECHRVGTFVFSRALMKHTFKYSLGLSATVVRKDGMTKAFTSFLGEVVYKGKRRIDEVRVSQHRYFHDDLNYSREEMIASIRKPNMSRMINNICAFLPRNKLILELLRDVLQREPLRKILVLSDRKDQLATLKEGLSAMGISAGFYYGGLKPAQLAESETKDVLLATFAYAAEGMDCRGLDTLFLVSPKSDIEQSCGRILRERANERPRIPLIFDIVDCFSLFERQGAKRLAYYKKNSYQIVDQHDSQEEIEKDVSDDDAFLFRSAKKV